MTEDPQCTSSARYTPCPYRESLDRLDRQIDHIPLGWQRLYGDLRHALRLLAADSRMNIRIDGAWEEDGRLRVDSDTRDPAVQGVLRKARTRAMHICSMCGRPGKRRELANWQEATWCGNCAGPRLLSQDIERALALAKCGSVDLREELQQAPDAVLIRAAAEAAATGHGLPKDFVLTELSENKLRAWLERVRAFVDASPMKGQR